MLRGSVGQAFRPPTIYNLFRTWRSVSGVTYNSNPFLKPETTTSWEIGGEQKVWKGGVFKATYFENYVNDLIYQYNVNPTTVNSVNVGKANIKGFELALEQKFDNWLNLFANYTHNDATLVRDAVNPAAVGCQLAQVPAKMFNAGGDFTYKSLSGSLIGRYVSKRFGQDVNSDRINGVYGSYDPFFTADAKLSYQVASFVSVSLAVNNIFDKNYFVYYQAPGRQWFGTVTLNSKEGAAVVLLAALLMLSGGRARRLPRERHLQGQLGRSMTVPLPVRRAVFLISYELVPVLGVWDRVVGVARWAYDNDLVRQSKPDIRSIPSVGSGTRREHRGPLRLKPDVVVTWTFKPELVRFMEERGLR